jgi:Resolvase, N terminal domain
MPTSMRCPFTSSARRRVVSKMDRLTRSVPFLNRLLEAGVDVRFADLPRIEGATGRFLLQMMVSVAELEAGMISRRTKDALAQAKKRGVILGGNRGVLPTAKMRALSAEALRKRADARAADLLRRSESYRWLAPQASGLLQTASMPRTFPRPAETANGRQRRSHACLSASENIDGPADVKKHYHLISDLIRSVRCTRHQDRPRR